MNKAVIGILLLLISGLAGAFVYIRKLRAKSAESTSKLQAATSQVASLQTNLKDQEAEAQREAQQLKQEAKASGEKLEEEKKAKKAELMRITAERKSEKARRDALEKMKNAKIAELTAKQKRHEAEISKTEERRQAALKEADAARAKAKAARNEADRAIAGAKRAKNLADRAKRVADQRARQAGIQISRAKSQQAQAQKRVAAAARDMKKAQVQVKGVTIKRNFESAAQYNALPGYPYKGVTWAGNRFNVTDPNVCRGIAQSKGLHAWGHRNGFHPNKRYKNSCFFYKKATPYGGNGNDKIHVTGCSIKGDNLKKGCPKTNTRLKFSYRNRKTPSNDWGGGNSIYLDRHNMDCGNDAIRQFRLYRPSGNRIAYNYSCLEGTNSSRYNAMTRSNDWGGGNTVYLDRHDVNCGNRNIHRVRLIRPAGNKIAYSYSCGRRGVATGTCRNMYTKWNQESNRNIYLDRHNVSCPGNTALTRFKLQRNGRGKFRYYYRCCQPAV
jgi:hypothetical protein